MVVGEGRYQSVLSFIAGACAITVVPQEFLFVCGGKISLSFQLQIIAVACRHDLICSKKCSCSLKQSEAELVKDIDLQNID